LKSEPPPADLDPWSIAMADPRPSDRRLRRAAILILVLVVAIVLTIFVTFNISHYRAMENEVEAANGANQAR
jgi:multisubunit Na+/H+ antiporter MnhB subunit